MMMLLDFLFLVCFDSSIYTFASISGFTDGRRDSGPYLYQGLIPVINFPQLDNGIIIESWFVDKDETV